MASLVLGAVGYAAGGPLGYMVGSALGAYLFPEKGPDGPRLTDLKAQKSNYGSPIPIAYGKYRVSGNVIWAADLTEHKHEQDAGSGGGSSTSYTYTGSFAVSVCEGPHSILRIWADGKLIYDVRSDEPVQNFTATSLAIYKGTEDQLPDPTMEAAKGVGNVPAYRGQTYVVFSDLELAMFGNRLPNLTFEVGDPEYSTGITITAIYHELQDYFGPYFQNSGYLDNTIYNPTTGRVWQVISAWYDGDYFNLPGRVGIVNPDTMEVVGSTTGEPGFGGNPGDDYGNLSLYLDVSIQNNLVVGWWNDIPGMVIGYEATTGAVRFIRVLGDIHATDSRDSHGLNSLEINPNTGDIWATNGYNQLLKLSPLDGSTIQTIQLTTPDNYFGTLDLGFAPTFSFEFDSAGNIYYVITYIENSERVSDFVKVNTSSGVSTILFTLHPENGVDRELRYMTYDPVRNRMLITIEYYASGAGVTHAFFDLNTNSLGAEIRFPSNTNLGTNPNTFWTYDLVLDAFWVLDAELVGNQSVGGFSLTAYDAATLSIKLHESDPVDIGYYTGHIALNSSNNCVYISSNGYNGTAKYCWGHTATPKIVYLSDIVADISHRVELSDSELNVSQLTDIVDGYCITNQMAARSALEPLMTHYFFDAVESDGKMKFVKRGGASVVTLLTDNTIADK